MNIFFWRKKKKEQPISEWLKDIMPLIIEAVPKIMELRRQTQNGDLAVSDVGVIDTPGQQIGKLYDFFNNLYGHSGVFEDVMPVDRNPGPPDSEENVLMQGNTRPPVGGFLSQYGAGPISFSVDPGGEITHVTTEGQTFPVKVPGDKRIEINPKAVLDELETTPRIKEFNEKLLQEKIDTLKDKTLFSNQRFAKAQIEGLIERLENRKKYPEYREFYCQFPNTTDGRIDKLLKKYKLVMKTTDLFVPSFPKEAIDVMKKYKEQTEKLCDKEPVFYVIAEEKDFNKKVEKLDPILLVQSPFGFFWQILGAWDKEMLLLSEL